MEREPAGKRIRVVVVDDHPVVSAGLSAIAPEIAVIASYQTVEELLAASPEVDAVLLDLQLAADGGPNERLMGTAAIRALLAAGIGPVVLYTAIAEEMLLAACLAAGARGAVTKGAPGATIVDVLRMAVAGKTWVDPLVAGALSRYAEQRHAGALSPQQANALRFRGQALRQQAIADRIGVNDPEVVNRYLRSAVEKLAKPDEILADDEQPGALIDKMARRSGLVSGLVRWQDLQERRRRR